ncbi:hypothetical protein AAVH_09657 [Aphelenchoides avenae]|nr:hypothetical protein AAVH_09657 [Aphelenchus avenae]
MPATAPSLLNSKKLIGSVLRCKGKFDAALDVTNVDEVVKTLKKTYDDENMHCMLRAMEGPELAQYCPTLSQTRKPRIEGSRTRFAHKKGHQRRQFRKLKDVNRKFRYPPNKVSFVTVSLKMPCLELRHRLELMQPTARSSKFLDEVGKLIGEAVKDAWEEVRHNGSAAEIVSFGIEAFDLADRYKLISLSK